MDDNNHCVSDSTGTLQSSKTQSLELELELSKSPDPIREMLARRAVSAHRPLHFSSTNTKLSLHNASTIYPTTGLSNII